MKVLIAGEEKNSSDRIFNMLKRYDPNIQVVKILESVQEVVNFYQTRPKIDLALIDTVLSDGVSFDIFNQVDFDTPVIFTTANEQYALQAFKVNSVDFILKPIKYFELVNAIEKYKKHWNSASNILVSQSDYKKRFSVKFGDHIQVKNTHEIACFQADGKFSYLFSSENGRKYIIEHTLEELQNGLLNPEYFFRINRQFIININSIEDVRNYLNRRLKVTLKIPVEKELIVSRNKVNDFKNWLNQ